MCILFFTFNCLFVVASASFSIVTLKHDNYFIFNIVYVFSSLIKFLTFGFGTCLFAVQVCVFSIAVLSFKSFVFLLAFDVCCYKYTCLKHNKIMFNFTNFLVVFELALNYSTSMVFTFHNLHGNYCIKVYSTLCFFPCVNFFNRWMRSKRRLPS